jgi:hypothetical protein
MDLLELIPVVLKNTLKGVFVNAFHSCPLRATIVELTQTSRKELYCYV